MFVTDEPATPAAPQAPSAKGRRGSHSPPPGDSVGAPACLVRVKAVPGARRDEIVGPLGDRLKIRVAAPPEDGRANAAICALLASALDIASRRVGVVSGHASPLKTLRVEGLDAAAVRGAIADA
ncbi:MAG: DUF167 domain-containing protein [Planctomycetota bacterium]|nr:DUF167 domain-containing protein [Planctomycetota bacterium]